MTKKPTGPTFWLKDNRYFVLTGETWQDCIFIALVGETPEKVDEQGLSQNDLEGAEQVEPWAVPFEWWRAFAAKCDKLEPNPPAKPTPEAEPVEDEQAAAEEELLMHVAAGTDLLTATLAAGDRFKKKAYKEINGPCPSSFMAGVFVALFVIMILGMSL